MCKDASRLHYTRRWSLLTRMAKPLTAFSPPLRELIYGRCQLSAVSNTECVVLAVPIDNSPALLT